MTAGIAKNNVERREDKLLAARTTATAFAGNNVIDADHGTGRAFRVRFNLASKLLACESLRKIEAVICITAEPRIRFRLWLIIRLFLAVGSMSYRIVSPLFCGVGQDRIGIEHLFEFSSSRFISRVAIGMVAKDHLAVGAFDFVRRRGALDAKQGIVVKIGVQLLEPSKRSLSHNREIADDIVGLRSYRRQRENRPPVPVSLPRCLYIATHMS